MPDSTVQPAPDYDTEADAIHALYARAGADLGSSPGDDPADDLRDVRDSVGITPAPAAAPAPAPAAAPTESFVVPREQWEEMQSAIAHLAAQEQYARQARYDEELEEYRELIDPESAFYDPEVHRQAELAYLERQQEQQLAPLQEYVAEQQAAEAYDAGVEQAIAVMEGLGVTEADAQDAVWSRGNEIWNEEAERLGVPVEDLIPALEQFAAQHGLSPEGIGRQAAEIALQMAATELGQRRGGEENESDVLARLFR